MILGFMQHFPWKGEDKKPVPTYFREKILAGAGYGPIAGLPKLHTFREDKHDRWKAGMSIQMVYRGPKYSISDHFNKNVPELQKCVSTQSIEIKYGRIKDFSKTANINDYAIYNHVAGRKCSIFQETTIAVDGKKLHYEKILELIDNDGFNSNDDFFKWFNKDWEGKIIHWSPMRY